MKRNNSTIWTTTSGRELVRLTVGMDEMTVIPSAVNLRDAQELIEALQDAVTFLTGEKTAQSSNESSSRGV